MTDPDERPTTDHRNAAFEARVAELERVAAQARRELRTWQAANGVVAPTPATDPTATPTPSPPPPGAAGPVARRRALQALGGAAVAGVAASVGSPPAAALDGDSLVVGSTVSAQSATTLVATATFSPVLHVLGTNTGFTGYPAAVQGSTSRSAGLGLLGLATALNGVGTTGLAEGDLGVGVSGIATGPRGRGGSLSGTQAQLRLNPSGPSPFTRSNANEGDIVVTSAEELWICVGIAPTTWRLLAGPQTANAIRLVTPYRAYDSRVGFLPATGTKAKLTQGQERDVSLASGANPPQGSTGALVNLTATNTSASGWLSIFEDGIPWPGTSTVNWSQAGATVANFAVVAMTAVGGVTVRAAGSADVIVDVVGFV